MKICYGCMENYSDELTVCPHCGFAEGTKPENALHMEPGSILADRYIIGKVIGFGGFGVTYIGWDTLLKTKVAVKEYLPSEFSTRVLGHTMVTVFSGDKTEQFNDGMRRFIDEAKKLAKFHSTPGIVKIFDSFECNNTAYIVMELLEGETLAEKLNRGERFTEDEAVKMMTPVIKSLEQVHKDGIIHRDIAPDNIFVTNDGNVKLIDFGAARYATTTHSRSLTVIIKPGYSPEEQYRSRGDQGAYTDVYALAATMYRMITGQTPPDALERRAFFENKKKDVLEPLHKYARNIDQDTENAILNALNVRIEDRTPNMQAFLYELTTSNPIERKAGTIRKMDVFGWPLWAKIAIPAVAALLIVFVVLMATINLGTEFVDDTSTPEGFVRVESVIGMKFDQAQADMKAKKITLELGGKYPSDILDENDIMLQDKNAGSLIRENDKIIVYVAGKSLQQVPNVQGYDLETAQNILEGIGFETEVKEVYSSVIAEGCIVSQSEKPLSEAKDHEKITLEVSKGTDPSKSTGDKDVKMPKLVGMDYDEAIKEAEKAGIHIKVKAHKYSKEFDKFVVMTQDVNANESVNTSKIVELEVSLGFDQVKLPDITNMTKADAIRYIESRGLICDIEKVFDESIGAGIVISQDPNPNAKVDPESQVKIKVSKGSAGFDMPNVVGKTEQEALAILKDQNGLVVVTVYEENDSKPEGQVLRQSVNAGDKIQKGKEVTITVCTHSPVVKVPNVQGKTQSEAEKLIKAEGLKVTISKENSDTVAKGIVTKTSPEAGSGLKKGDTVVVYISDGKKSTDTDTSSDENTDSDTHSDNKENESKSSTSSSDTKPVSATGVKISQTSLNMTVNSTAQLTAEITPSDASDSLSWESSNSSVASVSNGLVIAHKVGSATITVKTSNGKTASCSVTVKTNEVLPTSVSIDVKAITRTEDDTFRLNATLSPSNVTNHTLTWASDNSSVASVDNNGLVTCKGKGTATITVTTVNGKTAECKVTVNAKEVKPVKVILDKHDLTLYPGQTENLQAVVSPDDATDKKVTWSSSDESVATVADGKITAFGSGSTTITVKTSNGLTDTCSVSVIEVKENSKLTDHGNCGSNVEWQLFESGNLYIFGSGDMYQYNFNNSGIKKVIIEDGVTSIGNTAFNNCTELQSVEIPDSVTYIGERAFYNCGTLGSIRVPNNLREIGNQAFSLCIGLSSMKIPESTTSLGDGAFENCSSLSRVEFEGGRSNSLERIGESAFSNCTSLNNFVVPLHVNYVGNYAFNNCSGMTSISFQGDQPQFGGMNTFDGCDNITLYYPRYNSTWSDFEEQYWNRSNLVTEWDVVFAGEE